ncbi:hypothetical protein CPB83DRAFT_861604 [Crepidotus variabilis]|uniref:Uncharacterized protein n=1 Tax=Crepidotus variabilis TaxID=179855 RepID=A0A9P6E7Q4_9AGAR|nr:hypothetical protein CPB83DRAFT_861604 [Crepidotus variabilis]
MATPAEEQITSSSSCHQVSKIQQLGLKAQDVLSTFSQLEASISSEGESKKAEIGPVQKQRNFAHHRRRLAAYTARQDADDAVCSPATDGFLSSPTSPSCMHPHGVTKSFANFCEKLLLQNRIWKQQKQINALKRNLESTKSSNASHAFQSFCDRLIMSNNIWRLEREVERLKEDGEKLKRSRIAAVTRAAKQMVQDVRKERLTEEYVKELLDEMDGYRRAVVTLRAEHEKEISEMAEEFRKDSRRMALEIERLQLAQEARRIEQDLSNDIEEELLERLAHQSRLAITDSAHTEEECADVEDDLETLDGDSDDELSSNLSTSTFVGSGPCTPNDKFVFAKGNITAKLTLPLKRRATTHLAPLRMPRRTISTSSLRSDTSSPTTAKPRERRVDPAEYVGFSFNPLFFGNATISRTEDGVKVESPAISNPIFNLKAPPAGKKSGTLSSKASNSSLREKPSLIPQKRVAWKV